MWGALLMPIKTSSALPVISSFRVEPPSIAPPPPRLVTVGA